MENRKLLVIVMGALLCAPSFAQRFQRETFVTETPMVHDPVMAYEDSTYYLFATGMGIQQMTSKDGKAWTVSPNPVMSVIPAWATDSVPGFRHHVWAPDIIKYHGKWWMAYSCSTFGKNGSAIGLLSNTSLRFPIWSDEGCIVTSREKRDNWNAIDPNFVIDDKDLPWLVWGSFWDGIQLARLDTTMHIAKGEKPRTIARRYDPNFKPSEPNPTSKYAGTNAIEAPFIFKHGGYYYLFVSWDYCCRGAKSNYRVAVGRSRNIEGPYLDREGRDMAKGGGTLVIEGDKKDYEAVGHCAVYHINGKDVFISHGYSVERNGAAMLVKRPIEWTGDGWPTVNMGAYLMVYHKDADHGLHMAVSRDGYEWTSVNNDQPVISGDTIAEQHGIRDPHIFRGPDGAFYLAMTDLHIYAQKKYQNDPAHSKLTKYRDGEWERDGHKYGWGNNRGLVLMKSHDLKHWTRTNLDFSKLPAQPEINWAEVGCVWAPETVFDEESGRLMVHFTVREGTGPGRIFYVYMNDDFTQMTSTPKPLFEAPERKYTVIDSDIIKAGGMYHLFFVSHESTARPVHATSRSITGPYQIDALYNDGEPQGHEAPNCWKRIGEEKWVLMFDNYHRKPHNFGFVETSDFHTFKPIGYFDEKNSPMRRTNFSEQKHGAVIHITNEEAERLLQ